MKVFLCDDLEGHYNNAQVLVVAETEEKARSTIFKALVDCGLSNANRDKSKYNLKKLDLTKPSTILLTDGDY